MRIGSGYDVHKLVEKRKLILGGVEIPYEKGLLGHSDADVLIHAIMDALLGAAALGDIGKHFPDSDNNFKNISSLVLLRNVCLLLKNSGYTTINIDSTIIAQVDSVNVKATTEEGLGFTGSGEGIAAQAVCLIEKL